MTESSKKYRIFISAAEPSADVHCGKLISALREKNPKIEFAGLGGQNMKAAGCELMEDMTARAAMHYNVLSQLPWYIKLKNRVKHYFKTTKVDLVIVCDSPSFNFHIAKLANKAGIPTMFYVAPQLWAWGWWRIRKLRLLCDKLACILPFEQQWFTERNVPTEFVGNPLFDDMPAEVKQGRNRDFNIEKLIIALMPGSRPGEIETLWRPMQEIASKLAQSQAQARFITVAANEDILKVLKGKQLVAFRCEYELSSVISAAYKVDFTIVASGSATLQVAAAGCPMVIMYQSSKLMWHLVGKRLIKVPHLSLVNILAGKELVPEFMPYFDSIEPIYEACEKLISNKVKLQAVSKELIELTRPLVGGSASERVAQLAIQMLR